jgi:hypothetical protein
MIKNFKNLFSIFKVQRSKPLNIELLLTTTLKKNYGTHVIKLDIAPVAFPLGQHLFISASNNCFTVTVNEIKDTQFVLLI